MKKKEIYCLRCGTDRSLIRKEKRRGCYLYGTTYKRHIYK